MVTCPKVAVLPASMSAALSTGIYFVLWALWPDPSRPTVSPQHNRPAEKWAPKAQAAGLQAGRDLRGPVRAGRGEGIRFLVPGSRAGLSQAAGSEPMPQAEGAQG